MLPVGAGFSDNCTIEHQTRVKAPFRQDFIAQLPKRQKLITFELNFWITFSRHFKVQSSNKCNKFITQSVQHDFFYNSWSTEVHR